MKIETQLLENQQAKLSVEVEGDLIEGAKRRAARKIANRTKIPGFRPGKAPYPVVVRQFGEAAIFQEALELLVDEIYPKVIDQAEIHPYGPGNLENVVSMDPLVLEFVVPLEAEIELGDYHSIKKPYLPQEVSEEEIDRAISDLRDHYAIAEPVERSTQEGDLVGIRLGARRKKPVQEQEAVLLPERAVELIIRPVQKPEEDLQDEWPYPGFSRNLLDQVVGEEKKIDYTFPQDTESSPFPGVEAEFYWMVESVKSRTLPELDKEFLDSLGEYTSIEEFRNEIRSSLEKGHRQEYNNTYDEDVLEEAIQLASFKYPPQMLEDEIDRYVRDLENRVDLELYLKTRNLDRDGLREEVKPMAEARLKRSLYLMDLAKAEEIQITPEELREETSTTVNTLSRILPEKEARKLTNQRVYRNLVGNIIADLLSRKAMERLRDISSGELDKTSEQSDSGEVLSESMDEEVKPDEDNNYVQSVVDEQITTNHLTQE